MSGERCPVCHDLDPRDHPKSKLASRSPRYVSNETVSILSTNVRLVDLLSQKCKFCRLLEDMVESFVDPTELRGTYINLDLEAHGPARVQVIGPSFFSRIPDGGKTVALFLVYAPVREENPHIPERLDFLFGDSYGLIGTRISSANARILGSLVVAARFRQLL